MQYKQQIKSRLDRIYVSQNKSKFTFDWRTTLSSIPTDHWMVTVKYAPKYAPHIGKGRWTWPLSTLKDRKIMDWIVKKGLELQDDLKKLQTSPSDRSDTNNPQTMWKTFKAETTQWVAHEAKKKHYKQRSRVQKLRKDREEILTNPDFEENGTLQWNELVLAKEIEHLEKVMS